MNYNVFICNKQEKSASIWDLLSSEGIWGLVDRFFISESKPRCDGIYYVSEDSQYFALILCCAGDRDSDGIGRALALECAKKALLVYMDDKNADLKGLFKEMVKKWREKLLPANLSSSSRKKLEKQQLYMKCRPTSLMIMAGRGSEVLLMKCGSGSFCFSDRGTIYEFVLEREPESVCTEGFAPGTDMPRCHYVRKHVGYESMIMVAPSKTSHLLSAYEQYLIRSTDSENKRNPDEALKPFWEEIERHYERTNDDIGIAGYYRENSQQPDFPRQNRSGKTDIRHRDSVNTPFVSFGSSPFVEKDIKADLFHRSVSKKNDRKREAYMQALAEYRKKLKATEFELEKQEELQKQILDQLKNVEEDYKEKVSYLEAQKKYILAKQDDMKRRLEQKEQA